MKIEWMFFMTLIFGIISMVTRKKYEVKDGENQLYFPPVFWKILYLCFVISIIFSAIMIFMYKDVGISVFLIIMGLVSIFAGWMVERYKVILEKDELIIVYPIGKKRYVQISKLKSIEKNSNGGFKLIIEGEKAITLEAMLIGVEGFIETLNKKRVYLEINE